LTMYLTQTILRQNAHPSGKPRRESRRGGAKKVNFGPVLARCPDHRAASPADPACPAPRCAPHARRLARCRLPDCLRRRRDDLRPRRRIPIQATTTRRAASAAYAHRAHVHRAPACHRPALDHWPAAGAVGPARPARGRRERARPVHPARPSRNRANAPASTVLTRGSPGGPARLQRVGNPTGRDTPVTDASARRPESYLGAAAASPDRRARRQRHSRRSVTAM
jgi:hypothetical protein